METRSVTVLAVSSLLFVFALGDVLAKMPSKDDEPKTPECEKKEDRYIYPGEWEGRFDMSLAMARDIGGMDYNMTTRHFGKMRFLIMPDGQFGPFTASVESEGEQKIAFPDNDITGGAADNKTVGQATLELDKDSVVKPQFPGETVFVRDFAARGQMTQKLQLTINTIDGPEKRQKQFGGPVDFTFYVEQASCEVVKGHVDSPSIRQHMRGMLDNGFTVAKPPDGKWEVRTDAATMGKLNDYRTRLNAALQVPFAEREKAMKEATAIWSDASKSLVLRACFQDEWAERVAAAIRLWIEELLKKIDTARKEKSTYCADHQLVLDTIHLSKHNDLLGCHAAGFDGVRTELLSLMESYSTRIKKGEWPKNVWGLPCPAFVSDPGRREAVEKYLQVIGSGK